jgi:hypothetical protein
VQDRFPHTQAVTSYNLEVVASEFFNLGVDGIIVGEMEESLEELVKYFDKKLFILPMYL